MQAHIEDKNVQENQFQRQYRIPFEQTNKWKEYLAQNGFVVIKNFLKKQLSAHFLNQVWEMMEKLSLQKLKRNNIQSQKDKKNYPSSHHGGLMQYIGHAKFQWELRKLAKPIYQELWGTQDLKTSFDGVCFSNGVLGYGQKPQNQGLHVDQPPIKNKIWSYQGIMALSDAGTQGGGFVCVPKSHKYFHEYFKQRGMQNRVTSYNIPEQDRYKQPICNYIKVNVGAGDFMIFQSRTFHCGTPPTSQNLRVATYICMMPEKDIPPMVLQQRKQVFKQRMNSGHHCGDGFRTFSVIPRKKPNNKHELAEFQKVIRLINQVDSQELQKDEQIMKLV